MGSLFEKWKKGLKKKVHPFCTAIVPAAGKSSRMGGEDKMFAPLCGVPAVPVTDTVKVADLSGLVLSTPDRSTLFAVQTPQVFQANLLKAALQSAIAAEAPLTDDCSAVERLGKEVYLTPGWRENIKITTPEDLSVAELFLRRREVQA